MVIDILPRPVSTGYLSSDFSSIHRMLIPASSSRRAELWGSFALFSTTTAPSACGVSLNTIFDWIKYYFICFLGSAVCYCCSHLHYIYPGHTREQLLSYPRTRQNRYPASDWISISVHQCQRLSANDSRTKRCFCCLFSMPSMSDSDSCSHWWLVLFLSILRGFQGL